MAKITDLEPIDLIDGTESLPIVQRGKTARATMASLRALIVPYLQYWYKGDRGDPGPAGNVAATLAQLRAAPVTNVTMLYRGTGFFFEEGDHTGLIDDHFFVASDHAAVTAGAWKRIVSRVDVMTAGAIGDGVAVEYVAIVRAMAALPPTGGTIVFPDAKGYRLGQTIATGAKRVIFEIGTTRIICPPNAHGIVLEANGSAVRGAGRWATIFELGDSAIVYPQIATAITDGKLTSITATGGSGFLTTPCVIIAPSGAADAVADDAGAVATIGGGTIASFAIVAPGRHYTVAPEAKLLAGAAAAIVIRNIQGCQVSGASFDFRGQQGTVAVYHDGGWWAKVDNLDVYYDVATGTLSEHPTSVGLLIHSSTLGVPGAGGGYGGVYVSAYSDMHFTRRCAIGKDTSTFTTLSFTSCDFKNSYLHGGIGISEVNMVKQGRAGTSFYHLVNVDGLTGLGGDLEDNATWMTFIGSCNNIRPGNMLTYAAGGPRYRGQPGTGSHFDFASSNSPIEPLRIGSGGTAGIAYRNYGWQQIHRQGIQFEGDRFVDSSNVKLKVDGTGQLVGILDDVDFPGCAMVRRGSQMEWYYFAPGANPRPAAQFAVLNTDGIQIGGVGLTVAGKRVVGQQQPAITGTLTTDEKVDRILTAMRTHGLIAGA